VHDARERARPLGGPDGPRNPHLFNATRAPHRAAARRFAQHQIRPIAALGGIDSLVFTAGIGENSPEVRAAACANFGLLGLKHDPAKNAQSSPDQDVPLSDSTVRVLIVRAQEDWAIARDCWQLKSAGIRGRASAN